MNPFFALRGLFRRVLRIPPPPRLPSTRLMRALGYSEDRIVKVEATLAADHRRRWYSGEL